MKKVSHGPGPKGDLDGTLTGPLQQTSALQVGVGQFSGLGRYAPEHHRGALEMERHRKGLALGPSPCRWFRPLWNVVSEARRKMGSKVRWYWVVQLKAL